MATSFEERVKDREYVNWLKAGQGFRTLRSGLTIFLKRSTNKLHEELVKNTTGAKISCHEKKFSKQCGDSCKCWAIEIENMMALQEEDKPKKLNAIWSNCDHTKWSLEEGGPWEVAKCYMNPGQQKTNTGPESTDISGMLNLIANCNYIELKTDKNKIKVKEIRNHRNDVMHSCELTLTDEKLKKVFTDMETLVGDEAIADYKDADKALYELKKIKDADMTVEVEIQLIQETHVYLVEAAKIVGEEGIIKNALECLNKFLENNKDLQEAVQERLGKLEADVETLKNQSAEHIKEATGKNAQGNALERNRVELVNRMNIIELLSHLRQDSVITEQTEAQIMVGATGFKQNELLLDYLKKRPPADHEKFRQALIETNQTDLVKLTK